MSKRGINGNGKNTINIFLNNEFRKNTQSEQQEKRSPPNEDSVRSLWDNYKCTNIHVMVVSEREESEQENLFEKIMTENFPNGVKEIGIQV